MRFPRSYLIILFWFTTMSLAFGQTLEGFGVGKKLDYLQISSATPTSQTIIGDPDGPFHFSADITGSSLNLFSPVPKVTLPNATQYNLAGDSMSMGLSASYASKSALDTAYANGTYNFTVGGTTYPAALGSTDLYPAEIPRLTNGTWDGVGKLVVNAASGTTLNFSSFSNYTGGVGGIISFNLYAVNGNAVGAELVAVESIALTGYPSDPALTTYTIAAGFLQADRTYYGELSFARVTSLHTSLLPAVGVSTFMRTTGFMITTASPATAPVISTQPVSQTVSAGANVTLSVTASGNPTPTYQWRKNGVAITGATLGSYNLSNVQLGDAGTYTVIVSNAAGQVTSADAVLTVNGSGSVPQITTQPVSQAVSGGADVTLSVSATGNPAPTYQWRKDGVAIPGATLSSYSLNYVQPGDAGAYTVVVSNAAGQVTSMAAVLTVNGVATAPLITTQPASQTVIGGASVTFTVGASGTPTPSFQWKKNGTAISGATGDTYGISGVTSNDAGNYTVVATNSSGSTTSDAAVLAVVVAPSDAVITITVE